MAIEMVRALVKIRRWSFYILPVLSILATRRAGILACRPPFQAAGGGLKIRFRAPRRPQVEKLSAWPCRATKAPESH